MPRTLYLPVAMMPSAPRMYDRAYILLAVSFFALSLIASATSKETKVPPPVPDATPLVKSCKTPATAARQSPKSTAMEPRQESQTLDSIDSELQTAAAELDAPNVELPPMEENENRIALSECSRDVAEGNPEKCSTERSKAGAKHCQAVTGTSDELLLAAPRKNAQE